jgi:hypothetical protein
MENVARTLPDVPADVVESQLEAFQMLAGVVGSYCWKPAAGLLGQAAERCADENRRDQILRAAEALAARPDNAGGRQTPKPEPVALRDSPPRATTSPAVMPEVGVWHFFAGMTLRVARGFTDYDGQPVVAGELLHFQTRSYFSYDDGHTLTFLERVIRLSGNVSDESEVIDNFGNSYFEPLPEPEALSGCLEAIDKQWTDLGLGQSGTEAAIRAEIEECRRWLARPEPRGPAPNCSTGPYAGVLFPDQGGTLGLARLIAFLFAGIGACHPQLR